MAEDLEESAGPLSEWIDRAFPLVKEPDLFRETLAELNRNVRSLPEWFQPVDDNFVLGPHASSCALRWTWLGLANQSEPGQKLVDLLCGLEVSGQHSELDRNACHQFFGQLPEGICREIHAYLQEPQFAERVAHLRSVWSQIQYEFEGRFAPAARLRTCEQHLEQDWHYGEPLIADAVSRQDFAAAEKFIQRTLCSLLGWSEEELWHPEKLLLPESRFYRPTAESQEIPGLIDRWEEMATRLRKPERVASLRLQRVVLESAENWTAVLEAFEEYQRHLSKPGAAERLLAEWKQRIASTCAPPEHGNKEATDTWTHRLIEAQLKPSSGQKRFLDKVEAWLDSCRDDAAFFQRNQRSLALLTRHMPEHREFQSSCPTFHSHVLVPAGQISDALEQSLRQALIFLGEAPNPINVRSVWERHLHTLVPVPGGGGSCYRASAVWMRALSEVNPSSYTKLLSRWKFEFRRRRNLWQDMASARCPGL